ncbi:LLM class flavin-dependent oxidoreductase [Spirillospora sp. NPDC052242]
MTTTPTVPVSVLDTSAIWKGSTATEALRDTVELAVTVEQLGYTRYWVAEHHNTGNVASCAPPVLIGGIAAATSVLRVGSGGVMLPNHAPLVVAEQFGTLEALYPGRIDLGLGRAPGTDPGTAAALRRAQSPTADLFPQQVRELRAYFDVPVTDEPGSRIIAVPAVGARPATWVLGSSPSSARLAAEWGLPYAFANHFGLSDPVAAIDIYRNGFRPSAELDRPYALVTAAVIAADSEDRAAWLAQPLGMIALNLAKGARVGPNMTPQQIADAPLSAQERAFMEQQLARSVVGGPDTVRARLTELVAATGVDELMVITPIHDMKDRARSHELTAAAFDLPPRAGGPRPASGSGHA